jgi:putative redox protein
VSTARIVATLVDPERSRIEARTESGNVVAMDAMPPDGDGSAAGPRETLLAALAGCTAMDVISILRKKRQPFDRYELAVTGEAAAEHPRVYTNIRVEHRVAGQVEAEAVRRAVELSATRYCPVSAMLSKSVVIEHHYTLTSPDGDAREALVAVTGPEGVRVADA